MTDGNDFKLQVIRMICKGLPGPSACVAPECPCFKEHGEPIFEELCKMFAQQCGPQLPSEIDRSKHGSVLMVWNDCMINHETLEMTWPKLVKAMQEAEKRTDATRENK